MTHENAIVRLLGRSLLKDTRLSSQHLHVIVQDGCVTLRGRVRTEGERVVAGELASAIPGVRAVLNQLEVVSSSILSDSAVAENVRSALESHPRIEKASITVSVQDGFVVLTGTVSGHEERALALDIAMGADGVQGVQDALVPDVVARIEDAVLARTMKNAIVQAVSDPESRIRVAVSRGTGVLSGWVATEVMKCTAEAVARGFALNALRNEIQVAGHNPSTS